MSSIYEEHKDEDGFLYITYVPFSPRAIETNANKAAATRARTRLVRRFKEPSPFHFFDIMRGVSDLRTFLFFSITRHMARTDMDIMVIEGPGGHLLRS